jgi:hypothetical protein
MRCNASVATALRPPSRSSSSKLRLACARQPPAKRSGSAADHAAVGRVLVAHQRAASGCARPHRPEEGNGVLSTSAQHRTRRPPPAPDRRLPSRRPRRRLFLVLPATRVQHRPPGSRRHAAPVAREDEAPVRLEQGINAAPPWPDQLASVERGVWTPSVR